MSSCEMEEKERKERGKVEELYARAFGLAAEANPSCQEKQQGDQKSAIECHKKEVYISPFSTQSQASGHFH